MKIGIISDGTADFDCAFTPGQKTFCSQLDTIIKVRDATN